MHRKVVTEAICLPRPILGRACKEMLRLACAEAACIGRRKATGVRVLAFSARLKCTRDRFMPDWPLQEVLHIAFGFSSSSQWPYPFLPTTSQTAVSSIRRHLGGGSAPALQLFVSARALFPAPALGSWWCKGRHIAHRIRASTMCGGARRGFVRSQKSPSRVRVPAGVAPQFWSTERIRTGSRRACRGVKRGERTQRPSDPSAYSSVAWGTLNSDPVGVLVQRHGGDYQRSRNSAAH